MVIFKHIVDIQDYLTKQGRSIGFVPTMGALHDGHVTLVKEAKKATELVVCSIFINPTQFNDKQDFERYPTSVEADIAMLIAAGCDVLLLPNVAEMYPQGTESMQTYDFGYLDTVLEGAQRPGHFKGVGQIVARLLDIVQPHKLFMGQKDYQQCMVVKHLLAQLAIKTELVICPTQREQDGLAMSSRNRRLTEPQRALAAILYQCLVSIQAKQHGGNFEVVHKECIDLMTAKGLQPEYIALCDANDLTLLDNYTPGRPMVALMAVRVGDVRLIDNMVL